MKMEQLLLLLTAAGMTVSVVMGGSQTKQSKTPPKAADVSISQLVTQGNIPEAVKRATPQSAETALNSLMASADTDIALRKISEAQATLDAAQTFLDECVKAKKAENMPRDALEGRRLRLQGIVLSDKKDFSTAENVLRKALQVSKNAKDPALEAGVHNNLGYALRNQQRMEEASKEFEAARVMAEEQKDDLRAGSYNFNLGEVLMQMNNMEGATEAYKRAAAQNKAAGRFDIEGRAILMQGAIQSSINTRGEEAITLFKEAEAILEKAGDDRNAGWCYYLMGENAAYNMDFPKAAEFAEKAVPFLVKANDNPALQKCYTLLSDAYSRQGDVAKSEKYKKMAEALSIKK